MIKSITQLIAWIMLTISIVCLFIYVWRGTAHHLAIGVGAMMLAIVGFITDKNERTNITKYNPK